MSTPAPKPLHILRPGRHVAMSGHVVELSAADLAATAAAYDPVKHEAPIVVGHPKADAPAYGWVASLAASPDLEAVPNQVEPVFAEMVAAGRFKKISASLFPPDHPANPVPGVYYLRHVGFLGAQPPAVKGLRTPEFGDSSEGILEFADWKDELNAGMWRRLRDWLLAKFGQEDADRAVPPFEVGALERAAQSDSGSESAAPAASFSDQPVEEEQVSPEEKAQLEAENQQLRQQLADRDAAQASAQAAARHADHVSFADSLVSSGHLTPAQKELAVATLDLMAGQPQAVEFGEGDAKKPLVDGFKEFLSAMPQQIEFGETATKDKAAGGAATVDFAAPAGYTVDGGSAALHRKALEYQAAHPGTEYIAAVAAVSQ